MKAVFLVSIVLLSAIRIQAQEDVLRPNGRPDGDGSGSSRSTKNKIIIGPELGLNINFHSQSFTSNPQIENSPEAALKSGTGFSPMVGFFVDVPVSNRVGIQARLAYDAKSASNTQASLIDATLTPQGIQGFETRQIGVDASYCLSYNTVALAALARIDLVDALCLTAGPIFQFTVGDVTREDKMTVTDEDESAVITVDYEGNAGAFREISRETNVAQNLLPSDNNPLVYTTAPYSAMRAGLEFGLGYRFEITPAVYLAPNIRYQLMLTQLNEGFNAADISQPFTTGIGELVYDAAGLNTLAIVLQLGFKL